MGDFIEILVRASERAAQVARSCSSGSAKETLLVAEKSEGEANSRFEHDFKTIADVLAQETAKTEISTHFPELSNYIRGEECAEINGVRISLRDTAKETEELLNSLVLPSVAKRMAEAAHSQVNVHITASELLKELKINTFDVGIWIDPIDATAEFISGIRGEAKPGKGLQCVTVLIGAYLRSTGEPIAGVINQPFHNNGEGRIIWGVCYKEHKKWGVTPPGDYCHTDNLVLMSAAEKPEITEKLKATGWDVKAVPGAGHKLMKVALGEAAAYIVSQGTTFRWDTCAPHAILKARSGDVLCYTNHTPITYNIPKNLDTQEYCNAGGIIAYLNQSVLNKIII